MKTVNIDVKTKGF